jgi:lipopolysaccharide biosynthesis glycosyltransferase
MIQNKYLVYTLATYRTKPYLSMLSLFLESIQQFCTREFDILIICDEETHKNMVSLPTINDLGNVSYLHIPRSKNLHHALLHKCSIHEYKDILQYKKVMYLDCDIIVQRDLSQLFKNIKLKKNVLYAPAEGTLTGKFWFLDAYKDSNVERLSNQGTKSFNSGTFMFVPTPIFMKHFEKVKLMGEQYKGKDHFYDQSFFNYYFNINGLSSTDFITDIVRIFPEPSHHYPNKYIIHFAGIGRYQEKSKMMKAYLNNLIALKAKNT